MALSTTKFSNLTVDITGNHDDRHNVAPLIITHTHDQSEEMGCSCLGNGCRGNPGNLKPKTVVLVLKGGHWVDVFVFFHKPENDISGISVTFIVSFYPQICYKMLSHLGNCNVLTWL